MEYDPTDPTDDGPPKSASPTLTQPPTANASDSTTTAAYQYDYSYYYNYYTQNQQNGTTASYPQTATLDPQQQQQYQMQYAAYYAQAQVNPAAFANTSYYPYYPQVSYSQPPYGVCAPRTQTANQKPKRNNNNNNNNNNSNSGNSNKESLKRKRQDDEVTAILKKFKVKIPSDESPEEIAKWIEERRKKFPTRENVEKKRAEMLERNEQRRQMREKKNQTQGDQTSTDPHTEEDGRDEDVSNSAENYESTSNHRDRRDKNKRKRRICSYFLKGKCKQGANCKYLHEHPNPKPIAPPKRPPSLLTKLLDDTLQQEAQILLQCLVYINENNFFLDYSSDGEEDEVEEEEEEESSESSSEDSSDSEESDSSDDDGDDSNIENQKKEDVEEGELLEESFDQK